MVRDKVLQRGRGPRVAGVVDRDRRERQAQGRDRGNRGADQAGKDCKQALHANSIGRRRPRLDASGRPDPCGLCKTNPRSDPRTAPGVAGCGPRPAAVARRPGLYSRCGLHRHPRCRDWRDHRGQPAAAQARAHDVEIVAVRSTGTTGMSTSRGCCSSRSVWPHRRRSRGPAPGSCTRASATSSRRSSASSSRAGASCWPTAACSSTTS